MRTYRRAKGWGQEDLALAAGVKVATVQSAEQGKNVPRPGTARKYDDALGADGAVLRAFGYVTSVSRPDDDDVHRRVESLERELAELQAKMGELMQQRAETEETTNDSLEALEVRVERLERRTG